MTDFAGLYIHIPFCKRKCAYCDFYSCVPWADGLNGYTEALIKEIKKWGGELKNRPIDTIYLGGGTPSLLKDRISLILDAVRENFAVSQNAEITAEVNPDSAEEFLPAAFKAGVNRISVGVQSGSAKMLKILGRIHTVRDTEKAAETARKIGFTNLSVDLMIGLPDSDLKSLKADADFILSLKPEHISAYILKKEENTELYRKGTVLPDDDSVAKQYLFICDYFEKAGFSHYEISNFAKTGYESRHNLKYWKAEEYLGIGPSAHSFLDGKRFYYPRDIKKFLISPATVYDGDGGDKEEKMMLGLRLKEGIDLSDFFSEIPKETDEKTERFCKAGYMKRNGSLISLTDKGMLVSNSIITELMI